MDKKNSRLRRAAKTRAKLKATENFRLTVHRTPRHIYAQILSPETGNVVASASTLDDEVKAELTGSGNISAAQAVGKAVATRATSAGVNKVAFDRSGFKFHGRVKALAEAARENGLQF